MTDLAQLTDDQLRAIAGQQPLWQRVPSSNVTETPPAAMSQPSALSQVGRQLGLAGRAVAQGVASLPMLPADAGVALGNLAGGRLDWLGRPKPGSNALPLPSSQFNQALTGAGLPVPQNAGEKIAGAVEAALSGSRMPLPSGVPRPPTNFVSPADAQTQQTADLVRKAQEQGLVVPPATTNPTALNTVLETVGGKAATQQAAGSINQGAIQAAAKQSVGLRPDSPPLSADVLQAVRAEAGRAGYAPIKSAGQITAPPTFSQQLAAALTKYQGAERSFPGMGKTDLSGIVEKIDKPSFDAGDAIDLTKILRDKASAAYASGDTGTGGGLRQISSAVEDALDQGLQAKGPQFADALTNFRNARQTIATAHTIEGAMNPGTGNVSAAKLAAALRRGEPLSGPLRDIAQFSAAFPKAVAEPTSSAVSHLDMYAPLMTAILGEGPVQKAAGLLVPAARVGARGYLMSPWGQGGAIPRIPTPATGALPLGAVGARQTWQ